MLHGSSLEQFPQIGAKLARIDAQIYMGDLLKALLGMLLFAAACLGVGLAALRTYDRELGFPETSAWQRLARCATALVLGEGLYSIVFLGMAELGLLRPSVVAGLIVLGSIMAIFIFRGEIILSPRAVILPWRPRMDLDAVLITVPAIVVTVFALMYSSSRLSYDSVALYFSDAKATALAHAVRYFMDDSFVASILHTGINFSALMQSAGDQAARMYSWLNGVLMLLMGLALAEAVGLKSKALTVMIALVVSSTAMLDLMGDGKVELASSAPALAAVYWLVRSSHRYSPKDSFLIGFLAGQSVIARPYNAFILGSLVALFLVQMSTRGVPTRPGQTRWRWPVVLVQMGLGATPWILWHIATNWIVLGDPFSFIRDLVGVVPGRWQWARPPSQLWLFRILYPVVVSVYNTPQSLGTITPAFLGFLPLFLWPHSDPLFRTSRAYRSLVAAAAISLFAWLYLTFMVFEVRYVMLLWIILYLPLSARIAAVLDGTNAVLRRGARAFLAVLMAFLFVRVAYISLDTYSPVDATGNAHCGGLELCEFLAPLNDVARPGDRVLTLAAFRYYLRQDLFACSTTHDEYSVLRNLAAKDMNAFWQEVYRQGYRYAAYERNYTLRHLYFDAEPGPWNAPSWLRLVPIAGQPGDALVAYRIDILNAPLGTRSACAPNAGGIWQVSASQWN